MIGVEFHETSQFLRSELSVKIDDWPNGDKLDGRVLLKPEKGSVRMLCIKWRREGECRAV